VVGLLRMRLKIKLREHHGVKSSLLRQGFSTACETMTA
jgi:hypothetical protein